MTVVERFLEELKPFRAQYDDLSRKIDSLEEGPVRLALKKRRNQVEANARKVRDRYIDEQMASDNPVNIPRFSFSETKIRNKEPGAKLSGDTDTDE